jgi:Na+-translocating ferredoxin:NAD+ oxidoreductase subunit A
VTDLFLVFIAACLANNLLLDYLIGVSTLFAVSRTIETAAGMSAALLIILPITCLCCHCLKFYILIPLHLEILLLPGFVIAASLVTVLSEFLVKKYRPSLHKKISVFVPLLLVNSILLGAVLLEVQTQQGLLISVFFGIGMALGFGLILIIFAALRKRVDAADVPLAFQGTSILLITLSIVAMAFTGFTGIGFGN